MITYLYLGTCDIALGDLRGPEDVLVELQRLHQLVDDLRGPALLQRLRHTGLAQAGIRIFTGARDEAAAKERQQRIRGHR